MSKDLLRLIVVVVLIAVVTTVVYFVVNRPDDNKKLYDNYIALTQEDGYKNYEYLTKEFTLESGAKVSLISLNSNLNNHYRLTQAIKAQIEQNLLLLNYADKGDKTAQEKVLSDLEEYNTKAYGQDGVAYQARYLYEYYVSGNYDVININSLFDKLLNAIHEMELAGNTVIGSLNNYVVTYIYDGVKPNDVKSVMYDATALVACATASYQNKNSSNKDELYLNIGEYESMLAKLESLVAIGEEKGFNTLINDSLNTFISSYNALDRETILNMLTAVDRTQYINTQTNEDVKLNLTKVLNYLEAEI